MLQRKAITNPTHIQQFFDSLKSDEPLPNPQHFELLLEFDTETEILLAFLFRKDSKQVLRIDLTNYVSEILTF